MDLGLGEFNLIENLFGMFQSTQKYSKMRFDLYWEMVQTRWNAEYTSRDAH